MLPPLARRFVAGESAAAALEHARRLDEDGVGAIVNRLGEHYDERAPADADAEAYCRLVADIARTDLEACISVKPTQLGLGVSESVFRENLARVVEHAREHGVFVWIDMEDHTTTDATLDAFEHHARQSARTREARAATDGSGGGGVGVCVQANLRRTRDDLERLAPLPGKVRLVKGAYDPPSDIAYQRAERVNEAFREDLRFMFEHFADGVAVGSHDPAMVELAERLHERHGTPYEVQMLMGVRSDAQRELARDRAVYQYVPYGKRWLSYFYRRVTENVDNARFALRALLS